MWMEGNGKTPEVSSTRMYRSVVWCGERFVDRRERERISIAGKFHWEKIFILIGEKLALWIDIVFPYLIGKNLS